MMQPPFDQGSSQNMLETRMSCPLKLVFTTSSEWSFLKNLVF